MSRLPDIDYDIPIRYIEEDDWEDLPDEEVDLLWPSHPPKHFRDKSNGE